MRILISTAAAALAAFGIAAPTSAKPAGVAIAMGSFAAVSAAPDAAAREADLRARFAKFENGDCQCDKCREATHCVGCDERETDCADSTCTPSCREKTKNVSKVVKKIAPAHA